MRTLSLSYNLTSGMPKDHNAVNSGICFSSFFTTLDVHVIARDYHVAFTSRQLNSSAPPKRERTPAA